ncbi:siderophore-interacting protein [Aurantimonas sp. VKM B-3413]|uniref:siderophore-interacting protein n=1 Tax=Aurantimonas sp. VKM B-3413 TaxID=2779401 RepID=UPI001E47D3CE|nr:siderophore-interacting protein [Aurantimonas sp. VKM B-3413]MCB8839449.1 siderophore-interacting protein [Aurantimonas sp. VKM B-3413]
MNLHEPVAASPATAPTRRVRHELRRRQLSVVSTERLSPAMLRIVLGGEELRGFTSLGADDHVKIFLPGEDGAEAERRDYTPRHYDARRNELTLDFAVHEAGPATAWALSAKVGDALTIGGPRGSLVIEESVRRFLLIGDETALPAIGRRIEEAGPGVSIVSLVAVPEPADKQNFETAADLHAHWVHRPLERADDPEALLAALRTIEIEPDCFVWIAAEASVVRALRSVLLEERAHPKTWFKASGYWVRGKADTTEKFED